MTLVLYAINSQGLTILLLLLSSLVWCGVVYGLSRLVQHILTQRQERERLLRAIRRESRRYMPTTIQMDEYTVTALQHKMGFERADIKAFEGRCDACSKRCYHIYAFGRLVYRECPEHAKITVVASRKQRKVYEMIARALPDFEQRYQEFLNTPKKKYTKPELPTETLSIPELVAFLENKKGYGMTYAYTGLTQAIALFNKRLTETVTDLNKYADRVDEANETDASVGETYREVAKLLERSITTVKGAN
jgi:hypothetical protein